MADTTVQEQIVRESPEIEAYKLGLLQLAKQRASIPVQLPTYQVAGLAPEQEQAVRMAQMGLGAYLPFLQQSAISAQQAGGMYAGLPTYGAEAVRAVTEGTRYSTQQAQEALRRANELTGVGLGYGQESARAAGTAATAAGGYSAAGAGLAQEYGAGATRAGFAGAQAYNPNAVQSYMNPYQQQVTQNTLAEIRRQGDIARQGLAAQAVRSGAFGGSREGIQRQELERNILETQARTAAADYAGNYNQAQQAAMNAFQNQQARMQQAGNLALGAGQMQAGALQNAAQGILSGGQLASGANLNMGQLAQQAGQAGGQLGLNTAQLGMNAGQALGQSYVSGGQLQQAAGAGIAGLGSQQASLGQLTSGLGQGDVSFLYNLGGQLQGQQQKVYDAMRASQLQAQYEPFQRISFLSDIYKGAPSSQQTIAQSTAPSASPISQAAGLGITALGAYNLMNK